jgi:hypothetical protein
MSVCSFKKVNRDKHARVHTHKACGLNKEVKYPEIAAEDGKEKLEETEKRKTGIR